MLRWGNSKAQRLRRLSDRLAELTPPPPDAAVQDALEEEMRRYEVIATLLLVDVRRDSERTGHTPAARWENGVLVPYFLGLTATAGAEKLVKLGVEPKYIELMMNFPRGWADRLDSEMRRERDDSRHA